MYDITSSCADDFINHEEILDTLAYADQNKENSTLIDSIIQKAKKRKGLSHREASVLLACPIPEKNEEIFRLAEQIKKDFYGNRIVMFAPLYLSNYCINVLTALIMPKISISQGNSYRRKKYGKRSLPSRIWDINVLPWKQAKTQSVIPWTII